MRFKKANSLVEDKLTDKAKSEKTQLKLFEFICESNRFSSEHRSHEPAESKLD
jgi:hypothetical protein